MLLKKAASAGESSAQCRVAHPLTSTSLYNVTTQITQFINLAVAIQTDLHTSGHSAHGYDLPRSNRILSERLLPENMLPTAPLVHEPCASFSAHVPMHGPVAVHVYTSS